MLKFKISLTLNNNRESGIINGYRPDWTSDSKPLYNCGIIISNEDILPGETKHCQLQPLMEKYWHCIKVGDILKCMEGKTQVGEAVVLEVMDKKFYFGEKNVGVSPGIKGLEEALNRLKTND